MKLRYMIKIKFIYLKKTSSNNQIMNLKINIYIKVNLYILDIKIINGMKDNKNKLFFNKSLFKI